MKTRLYGEAQIPGHELTEEEFEDGRAGYGDTVDYFTNTRSACACGKFSVVAPIYYAKAGHDYLFHVLQDVCVRIQAAEEVVMEVCDCCNTARDELPYESRNGVQYCQECQDVGCDLVECSLR